MIHGGWFWSHVYFAGLEYNLENKWSYNDHEKQNEHGDGECIYIQFQLFYKLPGADACQVVLKTIKPKYKWSIKK